MDNIYEIEALDSDIANDLDSITNVNNAMSILANNENVLSNEDYSITNKDTILASTAELLGCSDYQFSNEGITDILKTIVNTLKKFMSQIWEKIMKLVRQVTKYMSNDANTIDEMIKNTSNLSTEAYKFNSELTQSIPNFLVTSTGTDSLERIKYLSDKLANIRKGVYIAIAKYIRSAHEELSRYDIINMNFTPFKDFFYSEAVGLYDNDKILPAVLADVKDGFNIYSNGFKFIVGYDKKDLHVVMPLFPDTNIYKVPCPRTNITIDTNTFYTNHINSHLLTLKKLNKHIEAEELDIIMLNNLLKRTDGLLKKNIPNYAGHEGNLKVLNKYIKEITVSIPNIIRSITMCNLVMYNEYKTILKNVYNTQQAN
jgi:hypothetical protein